MTILVATLGVLIGCISCKKENDNGIPTIIKGHVEDPIRRISISGYKVVLVKDRGIDYPGGRIETVAETQTDNNGDYLISFNYQPELAQQYGLLEQYYGIPYYHESTSGSGQIVGGMNIINMTAWKPVELKLNVRVSNNNTPPLNIRNEWATTSERFLNVVSVFQQNINATHILRTRPDTDINIIFYYTVNYGAPNTTLHQRIIPYHSTLDSTTTLDYVIDCSTF